jgi:gliding motility-associated-like protein
VTDDNGCSVPASVTITQPDEALLLSSSSIGVSCHGGNNGSASVSVSGGTPQYTYLWDDPAAQTTATAIDLYAGTYTVTVTDANDCKETSTITITEPPVSVTASATGSNVNCFGDNNGTVTVTGSNGVEPYTYLWDDASAQTSQTATNLATGTYNVVVTDANGCQANASAIVVGPAVLVAVPSATAVLCTGENTGSATVIASGGTAPYTYLWDDPAAQITQTATGLPSGNHTVVVTDANNCTIPVSVIVDEPEALVATITSTNITCFGDNNGTASVSVAGGVPPYLYQWNDPAAQTTQTVSNLAAGTYTVTVTDANNCQTTEPVEIHEPEFMLVVSESKTDVNCFGGSDGTATVNVSGGQAPYLYQWDDPDAQTTATATDLSIGTYTVTVTDSYDCVQKISITVSGPAIGLTASINSTNVSCYGGNNGSATVTTSNGIAPLTYLWNDPAGQNTLTATDLVAGTYQVIVTEASGCQAKATVTITEPDQLKAITSVTDVLCFGENTGEAKVTATGGVAPYKYLWDDPAAQTTATATGLPIGTYNVIVTDDHGCEIPAAIVIDPPPSLTINPPPPVCEPDVIDLTGQAILTGSIMPSLPDITYWRDMGAGQPQQITTADARAIKSSGNYYIRVDAGSDCYDMQPVTVTVEPQPVLVVQNPPEVCEPDVIDLTNGAITPGLDPALEKTYWHDMDATNEIAAPSAISESGTYYIIATNLVTDCADVKPVQVTVNKRTEPTFKLDLVYCVNSFAPPLPTTSEEGVTGYWNPATISTGAVGFMTYTFTPDLGQCAKQAIVEIEITDGIIPAFDPIGPLCLNSGPPSLPSVSNNSILGSWNPATIATDKLETTTYTFTPDPGQCAVAVPVEVEIIQPNLPPVANNDEITTVMNIPVTIDVLVNDSDDSGIDAYRLEIIGFPLHGTWIIESDYTITYIPEDMYIGTDEFTYLIYDDGIPCGALSDEAKVTITVMPPNQSPIAVTDEFIAGCHDIFGDLLFNDSDPDGDNLVIDTTPITQPVNGTVTIYEDGTFLYEFVRGSAFVDSFSYGVCDDDFYFACANATVYITVFADSDCDGVPDHLDIDKDNDGIVDWVEGGDTVDTDGDGVPDYLDIDSDGDGIPDIIEAQASGNYIAPLGIDENNNGLDDAYEQGQTGLQPVDSDGDGMSDFQDTDSDNDNVPDYIEGYDIGAKGIAEVTPGLSDIDGDGLDDAYDNFLGGFNNNDLDNPFGTFPHLQDFDGDGIPDWRDTDDDDDGILTQFEDYNNNGLYFDDDMDFDGHPDYLDIQGECTMFIPEGFSPNGDGIHDYFQIFCIDNYPNAKLLIFDRWGVKMYEHANYGNRNVWETYDKAWWDGSRTNGDSGSEKLTPGNYLYILVKDDGNMERGFVMISY